MQLDDIETMPRDDEKVLISEMAASSKILKQDTCQYKCKDDNKRWCRATSHVTCRRCKFYSPTNRSKLQYLTETINLLRNDNKIKDYQIEDLRKRLKEANDKIEYFYALSEEDDQYEC